MKFHCFENLRNSELLNGMLFVTAMLCLETVTCIALIVTAAFLEVTERVSG